MKGYEVPVTAFIAFSITAGLGIWAVPFLKRIKYGQTTKEIGPTWHKKKDGTPTMGGIMFIIGISLAVGVGYMILRGSRQAMDNVMTFGSGINTSRLFLGVLMSIAYGFTGFIDDYIKVVKKRNLGLSAREKTVMQVLFAAIYLLGLYLAGDRSTILIIPFMGQFDLGLLYYPFCLFVIYGTVNAVNITDGIDGLCSSVTFVAAMAFMVVASLLSFSEMGLLATALAGGCLGFLVWNFHPAKIFMGDTGSLFLGGILVALAFGVGQPFLLVPIGIVYIIETLSDIIQIASYKLRKKRVFKMAPIHHHFEMLGWSEKKIVLVFSTIGMLGALVAVYSVLGYRV